MAKLTHIEDVERRNAEAEEEREMLEAQEALQHAQQEPQVTAGMRVEAKPAQGPETPPQTADDAIEFDPELDVTAKAEKEAENRTAEEEADFHGLSSEDSMSGMQKALIILALVIFVAAILYVVNSWVHFV